MFEGWRMDAAPGAREVGYANHLINLKKASSKSMTRWQSHFDHCQTYILHALAAADQTSPLTILNDGWGYYDLPLQDLNNHTAPVQILSPSLLNTARRRLKQLDNITPLVTDPTGAILQRAPLIFDGANTATQPPQDTAGHSLLSVNFLWTLLETLVPFRHPNDDDIDLALNLTRQHIADLRQAPGKSLLITPYARYESHSGKSSRLTVLSERELPGEPFAYWDWHYALLGKGPEAPDIHLKVGIWWL